MDWLTQLKVIGEIALAMVLCGAVGVEREAADKPAGLRTHMLVGGAAAMFVALGDALLTRFNMGSAYTAIQSDPIRITQAIITGVSFLGAGTILRRAKKEQVEGLTTAASILLCSGIGIAVALQQYVLAVGTTILAVLILRVVYSLECRISECGK